MKIALICGGPSLERGVSLNSARSVCDHLHSEDENIEIIPIYFNEKKKAFRISRAQLYSNTPSDFDFKLSTSAKALSETGLKTLLKSVDLAFPVMHGQFGEDGQIQRLLKRMDCPFIGSPEEGCKKAFDKFKANHYIAENGFFTLPSTVLKAHVKNHKKIIDAFFKTHNIKRAIVKPATGGSSISVHSVSTPKEALKKAGEIFSKRVDSRVVIEPFCEGVEFTVVLLQNRFGQPVAVMPSEIDIDYKDHQLFDYRKKYLASNQVTYHCPPRFDNEMIEKIQIQAEQLFLLFGMQDFARFDGWVMPDGNIWFSDFNPISGMEQNSFLFMQSSRIGMSHQDTLHYILKSACRRYSISLPEKKQLKPKVKKNISVLFGGDTAERQVSVMSGTNVWLKLRQSKKYTPSPFLLDTKKNVWRLPYALTLNHTVEEITQTCLTAKKDESRLHGLIERVQLKLAPHADELSEPWFAPEKMSLDTFIKQSDFVFTGLHGGIGENGHLQTMLQKAKTPFNGSPAQTSQICMNKFETGTLLSGLEKKGIHSAKKKVEELKGFKTFKSLDYKRYWNDLLSGLSSRSIIVKPVGDGCSAGIARLFSAMDLKKYVEHAQKGSDFIPHQTLTEQHGIIDMPTRQMKEVMFEAFITTDRVRVINSKLKWTQRTDWIEITMGVVEVKQSTMKKGNGVGEKFYRELWSGIKKNNPHFLKAMNPSLTVAQGNILSLEEKFQGGTGINITPPPHPFVKKSAVDRAKWRMEVVAQQLGIRGYARIDAFMHRHTGELIIIEVNSAPALTGSTVIYHQALEEEAQLYPTAFLENIVEAGMKK